MKIEVLKVTFIVVMLLHGLIHMMGFAKGFGFSEIEALKIPISKSQGTFWGLATLAIVGAVIGYAVNYPFWWVIVMPGVVISQAVIITSWGNAKFGTIPNVLLLIMAIIGGAEWNFAKNSEEIAQNMVTKSTGNTWRSNAKVPAIVDKWLLRSGVSNQMANSSLFLEQSGELKTSQTAAWQPFTSKQWVTTNRIGFVWAAKVGGMPPFSGRDQYQGERASMLIKAVGLVPVVDVHDKAIAEAALIRYLSEMVWYPHFALDSRVVWEPVGDTKANATLTDGKVKAVATFEFNPAGDCVGITAKRGYTRPTGTTLENWVVTIKDWSEFSGKRLPSEFEVSWDLKEGRYTWLKMKVLNVRSDSAGHQ